MSEESHSTSATVRWTRWSSARSTPNRVPQGQLLSVYGHESSLLSAPTALSSMSAALDLLVLATAWTHVFLAPYTKVEESFNLHAVHDVLMYGVRPNVLENVRTISPRQWSHMCP